MCKQSGETIDHLLLHCEVARELWVSIFRHFSVELGHGPKGSRVVG